jgi:ABC-type amino acid transport substrate-binding protein
MRFLFIALLLCAGPALAQNVRIEGTGHFPPYLDTQSGGMTGFDVEVMAEVCRRNGWSCSYSN